MSPTDTTHDDVDKNDGEPIADLRELTVGDRVVWDGRVIPCTVVDAGFGSHVVAEGPGGSIYRVLPYPGDGFRLGYRGGTIEGLRRVDPVEDFDCMTDAADYAERDDGAGGDE